jgi:sec-independent protein translocase protein TatA
MDVFAPWHIIVLLVVLVVLFGAKRLPGAAESLGKSMHIFKKSVAGLTQDDGDSAANPTAASPFSANPTAASPFPATPPAVAAPPADSSQQQLLDLQRQVQDLQRQTAGNGQPSEAQTTRPI